jgi:hypothetical protein
MRVVLVDLPEDCRRVTDYTVFPVEQSAWLTTHFLGERELRSRKDANCCVAIFRRSEPSSACIEVLGCQFVANLRRP